MITYSEKGHWLHDEIEAAGHTLSRIDGVWVSSNDAAVQAIIDSFDPKPYAQAEAIQAIDAAAGQARARYITVQPGQDSVYTLKREQAEKCKAAGYDPTGLSLIEYEVASTGKSAQQVADTILAKASGWIDTAARIEGIRMKAFADIASAQWQDCKSIADAAVAQIELI